MKQIPQRRDIYEYLSITVLLHSYKFLKLQTLVYQVQKQY